MSEQTITERTPEVIAVEIRTIRNQTAGYVLGQACEIGKRFIEAKGLLPHGKWGEYLRGLDYPERKAQDCMRLFEEYGKKGMLPSMEGIGVTQAVALLGIGDEKRQELIESGEAEAMSTRELKAKIDEINAEVERRQVTIDQLMDEKSAEEARAQAAEEAARKAKEEQARLQQGAQTALDRASKADNQAKAARQELASAQAQAKTAESEAEKLRKQLEDAANAPKPAPERVIETVEVIPTEVEAELERLRKVAATAPSETVIRLRAEYKRLVEQFKVVEELLDALEGENADEFARYRVAVQKAAAMMADRLL